MSIKLSLNTLRQAANAVSVPSYSRSTLSAGIVHFGVGNFHRAHQAVYLDDLFNMGQDHDWAIVGAGVLPSDSSMREKLASQDFLTTVVQQESDKSDARIIGSMIDILPIGDAAAIIATLADPQTRIVSLTITEGGYFIDAAGTFNVAHPAIVFDGQNPEAPKTVFGLIVEGLRRRRENSDLPFTVMSCDNIPHNGAVTRNSVVGIASLSDVELARWIEANVSFPNAMVDRITPATSAHEMSHCEKTFGIRDSWPVYCEEFKQWVLEDKFSAGRPAFERVGVQFVDDVTPYEHMKIRVLNGGHAALAYPAALLDVHYVHEAMEDPDIRSYLRKLETDEIIPIIPPVPNTDLLEYYEIIERRFSNPKIADTIPRLAYEGSSRQPKFILPSTLDNLDAGRDVVGLSLVSALWCHYLRGKSDSGQEINVIDQRLDRLRVGALNASSDVSAFIGIDEVFGSLGRSELFQHRFAAALLSIERLGVRATLRSYVEGNLMTEFRRTE